MVIVGVRELKEQASELLRLVREEGREVQVTYRGKVVALLIPVEHARRKEQETAAWDRLDTWRTRSGPAGQPGFPQLRQWRRGGNERDPRGPRMAANLKGNLRELF